MTPGTRKRIAGLTAALIVVVPLSVIAAKWQWSRHLARDARNAAVTAAMHTNPVSAATLLSDGYQAADEWRRVTLDGSWVDAEQLLVRKQTVEGKVGFTVLTPFKQVSGRLAYVLVGWEADPQRVRLPAAPTQIVARLRPVTGDGPMRPADLPDGQINRVVPDELAGTVPHDAVIFELVDPVPAGLTPIPLPELTDGPHVSYTGQWILIGLTAVVVYIRVVRRELHIDDGEPSEN